MPPLTSESESESVLGPGGGRENGDRAEPEKADGKRPETKSRELPSRPAAPAPSRVRRTSGRKIPDSQFTNLHL